ncbi:MAG: ABC transporter permease [Candidatus Electrothrix aestuarii]|uniref:ABC transporter permease n=1 Tax=Candidatus Electrothrix aestuarii TaxID=3062594 RepID=A0AAU8LZK7_9BACT|nr:ABC transporter permease [Candidatus Electrothrix aestuarii]
MMGRLFAAVVKELLLLRRDRAGLAVLFLMPVFLVVAITLVQKNVMELTGQSKTRLLMADLDKGNLGKALSDSLEEGNVEIIRHAAGQVSLEVIQAAVQNGDFQVGLVIPAGSSERLRAEAEAIFTERDEKTSSDVSSLIPIYLFFDPAVMPGFRTGLSAQLRMTLEKLALQAKAEQLQKELEKQSNIMLPWPVASGLSGKRIATVFDQSLFEVSDPASAQVSGQTSEQGEVVSEYNPVQQNVPAWALFGIFFTAIPIAGGLLQERRSGIQLRLSTLPVSPVLLLTAKVLAYLAVCCCQFSLITLVGAHFFPVLDLPAFSLGQDILFLLVVVLLTGLAACGYGIFLGTVCRTYEQASTLGSTTIVAAAALGGVMVPVYAMPQIMQRLSIISPLNWGLTAFHDILLRGDSLALVQGDLLRLGCFFLVTILLAWKFQGWNSKI